MSYGQAVELCGKAFGLLESAQKTAQNQKLLAEAANLYFQAAQADETLAAPYMGLAVIFYATGRKKAALGLLNKAKTLEPANLQLKRLDEQVQKGKDIAQLKAPSVKKKRVASMRERDPDALAKRPPIFTRIFGPIDNLFEDPESFQEAIQAVFHTQISETSAHRLFELMHETPSDLAQATQEIKDLLFQIKPEYGRKIFDFGADLAQGFLALGQTNTEDEAIDPVSDAQALKGKFPHPRALYQVLQTTFKVDLAKPKVEALYGLIERGEFMAQRPWDTQDLPRFQQLLGELKLLDKASLEASGELGKTYGIHTRQAVTVLVKKLGSIK